MRLLKRGDLRGGFEFARLRVVFQDVCRRLLCHDNRELEGATVDVARHLLTRDSGDDFAASRCHLADWRLYLRVDNKFLTCRRGVESFEEISKVSFSQHGVPREIDQYENV